MYLQVLQSYFASIIILFSPEILLAHFHLPVYEKHQFNLDHKTVLTCVFRFKHFCLKIFRKILAKKRQPGLLSLGNSDALALTALQGAISSCFAKLPEQQAAELAGEVGNVRGQAEDVPGRKLGSMVRINGL